jgi:RimJ/RimL family protein N-acetyltransferase
MKHNSNPEPPSPLRTDRLLLRRYEPADADLYYDAIQANRGHLAEFLPPRQEAMRSPADAESVIRWLEVMWQRREVFVYGIWELASAGYTGEVYLANADWHVPSIEVGYFLLREKTGQGYATEAARALVEAAFTCLGAVRVDLQCAADNLASQRVAERLGFALEGRQRLRHRKKSGALVDRLWYGLVREEYDPSIIKGV